MLNRYLITLKFLLILNVLFSQHKDKLIGIWDGGSAFAEEYEEKRFEFEFREKYFHTHYGPNHCPTYISYKLKGDTITLVRDPKYAKKFKYRAKFKIITLTSDSLIIEALNWAAVYVSHDFASAYHDPGREKGFSNSNKNGEDLSSGGILRTRLEFVRIKK